MTIRIVDWINSPAEWGVWGTRANGWFNELASYVREGKTYQADDSVLTESADDLFYIRSISSNTLNPFTGWTDYGGAFGAWRIYMSSQNAVNIDGLVKNTSGVTKAANASMILIDTNQRPLRDLIFTCETSTGPARVDVKTSGVITTAVAIPNGGWVSLSNCVWQANTNL